MLSTREAENKQDLIKQADLTIKIRNRSAPEFDKYSALKEKSIEIIF